MRSDPGAETAATASAARKPRVELEPGDSERLLSGVLQSIHVRRRYQFFDWTQGHLQRLLPHDVLICATARGNGTSLFFDYFYSVPVPAAALVRLCDRREGLAPDLLEAWGAAGHLPLAIGGRDCAQPSLSGALKSLGFGPTIVHGVPNAQSNAGAHGFFGFVSLHRPVHERELMLADLIVPHLFAAYCKALAPERDRVGTPAPAVAAAVGDTEALSDREIEILHWVRDGKSNQEIGMILSISPLTVKNHVQRILRKLNATNRTQAVSRAIDLRILGKQQRTAPAS